MNDAPRRKLREIIERHGRAAIVENPRRLESLLRDYCGEFRREISVLTMALEERAVADILVAASSASALPLKVTLARLAQRLCDNLALSGAAARWSIDAWAWALDVISDAEFSASQTEIAAEQSEIEQSEIERAKNVSSSPSPPLPIAARKMRSKQNSPPNQTPQAKQNTSAQTANVTAPNTTFVVSANGGGNFESINEAVRNVPANSRILIREGLYDESIALDKHVEIAGDGALENIVVRSAHQPCVSMQTERATVRNLTLQGRGKSSGKSFFAVDIPRGELTLENCDITSDTLSCVAIYGADANPFLQNCSIRDGADSGVYIFDSARARVENCDVYKNANDNVAITNGARPTIKNCRVFEGGGGGIVVWGDGAAGDVESCEIFGHRLANVGVSEFADPTVRDCKIFGGQDTGVFVRQNGYGTFEDCVVHDHRSAEVVIAEKSNSTVRRCAIYNGASSGVFVDDQASAFLESCNLYDNTNAGISLQNASAAVVRRCNIHRNGTVAVQIKENSRAAVEDCDLRGNRIAAWETEHGVVVERKNNRE